MTITLQPDQWERAKAKAAAEHSEGMIFDSGEAVKSGVAFEWSYSAPFLTIEIKKKPWYIPMAKIESTIRESFEGI